MKLTLAEPKYIKDSISIISELVTEARFKITSNAIELIAMDPANVAMVIFKLLSSAFVEYQLEKDVEIAINLNNFKQIMKRVKPNDVLSLELTAKNKLQITLTGNTKRTFSLPIIDLEEKEQRIPDLQFPIIIAVPSDVLNDAIGDVDIVGESVSFAVDNGKFIVSAEGDLTEATIAIEESEEIKIITETKDRIKAKYSIEYLKKMIEGSKIAPNVKIQFNKDYPLKLEYKAIDKVMITFILAPRVEND
ncbi:proliferating cell nuclear antigen (pcna) [Candidatus Woesearchaeota archaeon]|nr:proliferating cell nuclear antigen (pcna) [Candidatus Woesearchaeota archaeon]